MTSRTLRELRQENEALLRRIEEAEQTLRAIRSGEVDSLVVEGPEGPRVYTLEGANSSYRVLVEAMSEGAATLARDGTVLYCNERFAEMLGRPLEKVMGGTLQEHVSGTQREALDALCRSGWKQTTKGEIVLRQEDGAPMRVHLSLSAIVDSEPILCIVATDLTEHFRVQELREREQRALSRASEFEALLNAVPAAVFIARDRDATVED